METEHPRQTSKEQDVVENEIMAGESKATGKYRGNQSNRKINSNLRGSLPSCMPGRAIDCQ